jgi:hypothetical protein
VLSLVGDFYIICVKQSFTIVILEMISSNMPVDEKSRSPPALPPLKTTSPTASSSSSSTTSSIQQKPVPMMKIKSSKQTKKLCQFNAENLAKGADVVMKHEHHNDRATSIPYIGPQALARLMTPSFIPQQPFQPFPSHLHQAAAFLNFAQYMNHIPRQH